MDDATQTPDLDALLRELSARTGRQPCAFMDSAKIRTTALTKCNDSAKK